jgi:beta-glucosidase/6-phospho-beta-glucosidase/beta-galactosidase
VLASFGYEVGVFPPGERDPARRDLVRAVLIDAHRRAAAAIRGAAPGARTGMTLAMHEYSPAPGAEATVTELGFHSRTQIATWVVESRMATGLEPRR